MAVYSFHYGTMNCGKSTAVLQIDHLLRLSGQRPILIKPAVDTRDADVIRSRMVDFSRPCILVDDDNIDRLVTIARDRFGIDDPTHIICDEAQFLSKDMVWRLAEYVDSMNMDVACYGLRTSYTGELFPGSAALMAIADNLIEMPAPAGEGRKAVMHLRKVNDEYVFDGEPVIVGDIKEDYEAVSREYYMRAREGAEVREP